MVQRVSGTFARDADPSLPPVWRCKDVCLFQLSLPAPEELTEHGAQQEHGASSVGRCSGAVSRRRRGEGAADEGPQGEHG